MATPYVDLASLHVPSTGAVAPVSWGLQIRENFEALIDPPACSAFNSAAVSVANASATILNANSEQYDNDAMHSTVSSTSKITAVKAGRYLVTATVEFATNSGGFRQIQILLNSVAVPSTVSRLPGFALAAAYVQSTVTMVLAAGDFIECQAFHDGAGGPLNTTLREFTALFLTRA